MYMIGDLEYGQQAEEQLPITIEDEEPDGRSAIEKFIDAIGPVRPIVRIHYVTGAGSHAQGIRRA